MKHLIYGSLAILGAMLVAQTTTPPTGVVIVGTIITATAGTITCVVSNPSTPTVHVACTINTNQVLVQDSTPAVGATNGAVGSFSDSGNNVTWTIQQPTAETVTWSVAANGVIKSGTF